MPLDDQDDIDPSQPLTIATALQLGTRLHRLRQLDDAYAVYTAVLEAEPDHPDALQFLGILEHQRQNHELALRYMQRALSRVPEAPGLHLNFGNILLEQGRFEAAAEAYERAVQFGGETPALLCNIGVLRRHQGLNPAAAAVYLRALELDPEHVDAYTGYGRVLQRQRRYEEALQQYFKALELEPDHASARYGAARALSALERLDEAAQVFRDWLAVDPDNPSAKHYLAACTGVDVPQRASDAFVTTTFDDFAQSFDARLEALNYRAPELVGARLCELNGAAAACLDVLDAGCGTGLCGPLLRPYARSLTGVDLSERMLDKARARGGYDALHARELTAFIQEHPAAYDLIASADTLCYFGDLEPVCSAAYRALRPGGRIVFTVEALPQGDFKLHLHGRYAHSRDYLQGVLARAKFADITLQEAALRKESGAPVKGYVVAARRASDAL